MMMTCWLPHRRRGLIANPPEPLIKRPAEAANVSFKNCRRSSAGGGSYRRARCAKMVEAYVRPCRLKKPRGCLQRKRENLRFCSGLETNASNSQEKAMPCDIRTTDSFGEDRSAS